MYYTVGEKLSRKLCYSNTLKAHLKVQRDCDSSYIVLSPSTQCHLCWKLIIIQVFKEKNMENRSHNANNENNNDIIKQTLCIFLFALICHFQHSEVAPGTRRMASIVQIFHLADNYNILKLEPSSTSKPYRPFCGFTWSLHVPNAPFIHHSKSFNHSLASHHPVCSGPDNSTSFAPFSYVFLGPPFPLFPSLLRHVLEVSLPSLMPTKCPNHFSTTC